MDETEGMRIVAVAQYAMFEACVRRWALPFAPAAELHALVAELRLPDYEPLLDADGFWQLRLLRHDVATRCGALSGGEWPFPGDLVESAPDDLSGLDPGVA